MRRSALFSLIVFLCGLLLDIGGTADGRRLKTWNWLCPGVSIAGAQVRGTISEPGERKFPIAVSPLKSLSADGETTALAAKFADIVASDLTMSGFFRVIPRASYVEPPDTSGFTDNDINFDNWSVIGALTLVKGSLVRENNSVALEARLFDVYQRRQLLGRRFRGDLGDVRRMAHRFADEIMLHHTGARGPFDSRVVFLSTREGKFKDVYVTSLDGGDIRRITADKTLNLAPSWAPDLRTILVTSYVNRVPELFSIRVDGGAWVRIPATQGLNLGGRWSPDGTRIAVAREEGGNSEIFVVNPNGSVRTRLTDNEAIDVSPSWSPDGNSIAFCSRRAGTPQIYVISAQGNGLRRLTHEGDYNTSPAWSPRGDRVAYVSRVGGRFDIFTVRTDGSDRRRVTAGRGDNEDPSWAPDGRYLVFSSTRSGASHLYVSDLNGTNQVELTGGKGGDTSPSWSGWID
jgi:TolB protein